MPARVCALWVLYCCGHFVLALDERGSLVRYCAVTCVLMGVECWLLCVVRRMFGAQVCRVVRWLFGFGVVGGFECAVVFVVLGDAGPLLLSPCNTRSGNATLQRSSVMSNPV